MTYITEKERLLGALKKGEIIDRPPVICPGGMMNAAVTEIIRDINVNHNVSEEGMVEAAKMVREKTGFENYGVPFCMTVESEPFGVKINFGDKTKEPRITEYNNMNLERIMDKYRNMGYDCFRIPVVLSAIAELKNDSVPVIGNIAGPISTATSIADPLMLFKLFRKNAELAYKFIEFVNEKLVQYAKAMIKNGADVIAISDPSATGELLGKRNFEMFALPMHKRLTYEIHKLNTPVILHICGNTGNITESLSQTEADAYSFDSMVNIKEAKKKLKSTVMGNVSTQLLQQGPLNKIKEMTQNCINLGVDIISPACGLSMSTPVKNLRVMTECVKGENK